MSDREHQSALPEDGLVRGDDEVDTEAVARTVQSMQKGDGRLRDGLEDVHQMVRDLEVQLNYMVSVNEAVQHDLEACQHSRSLVEKERDELRRKQEDSDRGADLREVLEHLAQENARLGEQLQSARDEIARCTSEGEENQALSAHLRAERDFLREENDLLEAQLAALGAHLAASRELDAKWHVARDEQARQVQLLEERLRTTTAERDALRQEVHEARTALEEIKRSIKDGTEHSLVAFYES